MEEKVSVIVPIYNVEKYLDQCVDSIVNQTYKNLEIILVNDGSPDNCGAMCDKWGEKDPRIIVVHQENQGVQKARNAGIDLATGYYTAIIDSDDYLHLEMIETLVSSRNPDADIVICNKFDLNYDGTIAEKIFRSDSFISVNEFFSHFYEFYLVGGLTAPWNKLYLTYLIKDNTLRFNPEFNRCDDTLFNLQYYQYCKYIQFIKPALYYYRHNSESITKTFSKNFFDISMKIHENTNFIINTKGILISDFEKQYLYESVLSAFLENVHHLAGLKNPLSHKERISQINATGNSVEVREALALCTKSDSYKMKIVRFLAKRKLYTCLYWIYYVGYRLKRECHKIKKSEGHCK